MTIFCDLANNLADVSPPFTKKMIFNLLGLAQRETEFDITYPF
jgi:hypothetical protein